MKDKGDNVIRLPVPADSRTAEHREWLAKYDQPHERGRHGVLLHVPAMETMEVERAVVYFMGERSMWRKFNEGHMSYDYEYVYQGNGKVDRPWKWCGDTVLFQDWQQREQATANLLVQYRPGQRVSFADRAGHRKEGIVSSVGTRNVMVVVEHEGTYRVPPAMLAPVK